MGVLDKLVGLHLAPIKELWQDREVRFGCSKKELSLKEGETILGSVDGVEVTNAHNGISGKLLITNLRLQWWSKAKIYSGLSIGFGCFILIVAKLTGSKSIGATAESLHIAAKHQDRIYDFVFTPLNTTTFQVYNGVSHVYSIYDKTRLYRDVKLGGTFLEDGNLDKLAFEQGHSKVDGVWNPCGGEGDVGTMYISNVRVVWVSGRNPTFNMSIPFNQVHNVKVRDSKYGPALMLVSSQNSGSFAWHFKVEPRETLDYLCKLITDYWKAHNKEPFYGIDIHVQTENCMEALSAEPTGFSFTSRMENVRRMNSETRGDAIQRYFASSFSTTSPKSSFTSQSPRPTTKSFTGPSPLSRMRPTSPSRARSPLGPHSRITPDSRPDIRPVSPVRPSSASFSGPTPRAARRAPPAPSSLRPSGSSFTGGGAPPTQSALYPIASSRRRPSAGSLIKSAASSFTSKTRRSSAASSKDEERERELVLWCNPVCAPVSASDLNAEHI